MLKKYLVKMEVVYDKEIFVRAHNKEEAAEKAAGKQGIQVGLPKYSKDGKVLSVDETDLDIKA
jgi:hypothetical protein